MTDAELGDEFRRIFCRVHGEGFGDDEERLSEFADGELFSGALILLVLELVDGEEREFMVVLELTTVTANSSRYMWSAVSTAPPPGTMLPLSSVRLTTDRASCTDRSISSSWKSSGPRRMIEAEV